MGRQIRLKGKESAAFAAALLDPSIAARITRDQSPSIGGPLTVRKPAATRADDVSPAVAGPIAGGSASPGSRIDPPALSASPALSAATAIASVSTKRRRKRTLDSKAVAGSRDPRDIGAGSVLEAVDGSVIGVDIEILLRPVPKERAKIVRMTNGGMSSFTPTRTKVFTELVRGLSEIVMAGRPPVTGPVEFEFEFDMPVPDGWPKWRKAAALEGLLSPTARPDLDNLEKAVLDAFNEILFVDDALVAKRDAIKKFGPTPRILVRMKRSLMLPQTASRADVEAFRSLLVEQTPAKPRI